MRAGNRGFKSEARRKRRAAHGRLRVRLQHDPPRHARAAQAQHDGAHAVAVPAGATPESGRNDGNVGETTPAPTRTTGADDGSDGGGKPRRTSSPRFTRGVAGTTSARRALRAITSLRTRVCVCVFDFSSTSASPRRVLGAGPFESGPELAMDSRRGRVGATEVRSRREYPMGCMSLGFLGPCRTSESSPPSSGTRPSTARPSTGARDAPAAAGLGRVTRGGPRGSRPTTGGTRPRSTRTTLGDGRERTKRAKARRIGTYAYFFSPARRRASERREKESATNRYVRFFTPTVPSPR